MRETKADYADDVCPACKGTGTPPDVAKQQAELLKQGIVSAPKCPVCGGNGRAAKAQLRPVKFGEKKPTP